MPIDPVATFRAAVRRASQVARAVLLVRDDVAALRSMVEDLHVYARDRKRAQLELLSREEVGRVSSQVFPCCGSQVSSRDGRVVTVAVRRGVYEFQRWFIVAHGAAFEVHDAEQCVKSRPRAFATVYPEGEVPRVAR